MKQVSKFIITKRFWIFAVMLCLTAACAVAYFHVSVNTDMTKYLSDDSSMRAGLEIMNETFPAMEEANTIRVMSDGLTDAEKDELLAKLKALPHVDSVTHDGSKNYNQEQYALFVLNTSVDYESEEMAALEAALSDDFGAYNIVYQSDNPVVDALPLYIILIAILLAMIVLFFMSDSWIEPILFLTAIGFAVVINAGTNIFLGEISNITASIAAILQMVLSMDYSIILINRYRQEKSLGLPKVEAMIAAVRHSFSSIAGSSLTTVAGLLALVFMNFKIGYDLGIVLAKGVFISMVCVLLVLPTLILACDRLIVKTAKKALHIPTGGVARLSYKLRRVFVGLFVLLFGAFYVMQGYTGIAFSVDPVDPVADVFPKDNMLVMVYENEDEARVAELADWLEKHENVKQVMGYPNLLGKQYTAAELADSMDGLREMMGADTGSQLLDPNLLQLIYYHAHGGAVSSMKMGELLTFLQSDVLQNEAFAPMLGEGMSEASDRLGAFADPDALTAEKSAEELAAFLGMDPAAVEGLLLLHATQTGAADTKLTVSAFAAFILDELATDPQYGAMFDEASLAQIRMLKTFTDKEVIHTPMSAAEIAAMLGMDETTVQAVFTTHPGAALAGGKLSVYETVSALLELAADPAYAGMMDQAALLQLGTVQALMQTAESATELTAAQLAAAVGMDGAQVEQLYLLYANLHKTDSAAKLSVQELMQFIVSDVLPNEAYAAQFDEVTVAQLKGAAAMIEAVTSEQQYTAEEAHAILGRMAEGLDVGTVELLYFYRSATVSSDPAKTLSIAELVEHLNGKILTDPLFAPFIDDAMQSGIKELGDTLGVAATMLKTKDYSRLIISTSLPEESPETTAFMDELFQRCDSYTGNYYFIGNSSMNYELANTFDGELMLITLLTSAAIFLIVMLSFRSLSIPLLLVLIVQCGVYITVTVVGWQGYDIHYMALLIVECILMGATIDYGILFTNYYRENRKSMESKDALTAAYRGSIHTVLTSGAIIVIVTGILGYTYSDPTVSQICRTISIGALSAILLILFVLPGMLTAFDRLIISRKRAFQKKS